VLRINCLSGIDGTLCLFVASLSRFQLFCEFLAMLQLILFSLVFCPCNELVDGLLQSKCASASKAESFAAEVNRQRTPCKFRELGKDFYSVLLVLLSVVSCYCLDLLALWMFKNVNALMRTLMCIN
jgi:hypothetical protein